MNETTTQTSTESENIVLPKTAHEAADACEAAINTEIDEIMPDSAPDSETAPSATAPNGTAPDLPISDESALDATAPRETGTLPNSTIPSRAVPDRPTTDRKTPQPEAPPSQHTNPQNNLRLRMKVWTDPQTLKRYLMPTAFMRDVVNGQPVTDAMYAYAMRDDDTKLVTLTAAQWNSLPFFYFQEDGYAPRATMRPVDIVP